MDVLKTTLPYIISGISVGGQYALIAIGYTMVYGILRLINFAHGDVFMVAGLMMVYLSASLPLSAQDRAAHVRHDLRHRRELSAAEPRPLHHRRPE